MTKKVSLKVVLLQVIPLYMVVVAFIAIPADQISTALFTITKILFRELQITIIPAAGLIIHTVIFILKFRERQTVREILQTVLTSIILLSVIFISPIFHLALMQAQTFPG